MPYGVVDRFVNGTVFNAGEYFRRDRHALVCGSFLVSLSSSMLNLIWPWEWSECGEVFEYWGVFIISILKYVYKQLPLGTCVM